MKRIAAVVASLVIAAILPAQARDLTPQVRAMIFAPTKSVRLAQKVVTIPLNGTDHRGFYKCPYMKVYVNGQGPFTFLFDTGASYTLISSKVMAAARPPVMFDRAGRRDVVRLAKMRIGGATLENVWAIHDDDFGVDGILGFPAFGASNLLFDLTKRQLKISASVMPLTKGFELPYDMPSNVPTIPVTIGQRTVQTLIDTGDDAYALELRQDELAGAVFAHAPVAAEAVLNGANVQTATVTTLAQPLVLGPVHADAAVVAINDSLPVGDFGVDMLGQFLMEFEPARRVVTFQPLFAGDTFKIAGTRSPGFNLAFDGSGKVSGVIPGTPADRAGIAAGLMLLSIDGRPAERYTPRTWDARIETGAPLAVRWRDNGTEHEATFPIAELR